MIPTCAIYNPTAGRGRAAKLHEVWQARTPPGTEFRATREPGHAIELATEAVRAGFGRIIAAGGDGTVHEVANGILMAGNPDVRFTTFPIGSMNDYAFTLGLETWWRESRPWDDLQLMRVDVGQVSEAARQPFFVNSCGLGFNGMVTIESRKIRWLRGIPLYALAVGKALVRHFATPTLELQIDDQTLHLPTLAMSLGLAQREGGFPLTAAASLDDGLFHYLHVGDIRRWELIRHFPGMLSGHLPTDHAKLRMGQCQTLHVKSQQALCLHMDGEFFCTPEDGVTAFEVKLHPQRLLVECYPPALYGGAKYATIRERK